MVFTSYVCTSTNTFRWVWKNGPHTLDLTVLHQDMLTLQRFVARVLYNDLIVTVQKLATYIVAWSVFDRAGLGFSK